MYKTLYDGSRWYFDYSYFNVPQGSLDCCSDTIIGMHYIDFMEIKLLENLIYNVHPFGISKNLSEKLPQKLELQKIIEASNVQSDNKPARVNFYNEDHFYEY